jgi:RNA-directed DNA polymerase
MRYQTLEEVFGLAPGQVSSAMEINERDRYTRVKTRGSRRDAWKPCHELGLLQSIIHDTISGRFIPHPIAHAYARGRGIFTAAHQHLGKNVLLHLDLKGFFGSITISAVENALRGKFPELCPRDINRVAQLCCREGVLPLGAPASCILCNLVCFPLDCYLDELAKRCWCTVTRYCDDICFSTHEPEFPPALVKCDASKGSRKPKLGAWLLSIIEEQRFSVNHKKVRIQRRGDHMYLGLILTDRVNVRSKYVRNIGKSLHIWKKFGLDAGARSQGRHISKLRFVWSLRGRIDHVGQATGKDALPYQRLSDTFEELAARDGPVIKRLISALKRRTAGC